MLCVSRRNLCKDVHVCVCVCVVIPASSASASPPGTFAIPLPPLFLHLAAHLLHFLQLKSKLSSIRSICRLGRESATPPLPSPSHPLITSSQASHEPLWASSSLVTHTLTHAHIICHISLFFPFPIWNCCCCCFPLATPPPLFYHLAETTFNWMLILQL